MSFEQINWGPLAAAALLITAPVLLLTLTVQRHIVASLAAGRPRGLARARRTSVARLGGRSSSDSPGCTLSRPNRSIRAPPWSHRAGGCR